MDKVYHITRNVADLVTVTILNSSDFASFEETTYNIVPGGDIAVPVTYLLGSDSTCISTDVGTISGDTLTIENINDDTVVNVTNAKRRVSVVNSDTEAIASITPQYQFVGLTTVAEFTIEYNSGFNAPNVAPSTGYITENTWYIDVEGEVMDCYVAPNYCTLTIDNKVPWAVINKTHYIARIGQPYDISISYMENATYESILAPSGTTVTSNGLHITMVNEDTTYTITNSKVKLTIDNLAPGVVSKINPSVNFVNFGSTNTYTLTYASGHSASEVKLVDSGMQLSGNTLTVVAPLAGYYATRTITLVANSLSRIQVLRVDPTDTTDDLPISRHDRYTLSQQIYTPTELGSTSPLQLYALAFNLISPETFSDRYIKLYLSHTTTEKHDWYFIPVTDADLVYSGFFTFNKKSWPLIWFNTPFTYNGTDNLLVTLYDGTGLTPSSDISFVKCNVSSEMSAYRAAYTSMNPTDSYIYFTGKYNYKNAIQVVSTTHDETISVLEKSTTSNYTPTNIYYKYSISQQLYTPAEIRTSRCTIKEISFKMESNVTTDRNISIYMDHYTNDTLTNSSVQMSSDKCVYSGTVTFKGADWTDISLDSCFVYNGQDKLLLTVVDSTGSYVNSVSFACEYSTYSTAIFLYSDSDQYTASSSYFMNRGSDRPILKLKLSITG